MDLEQALARYLSTVKDREGHQQENIRFIRWCGRDREVESLKAQEVEEYAEFAAGFSTDGQRHLEPVRGFLAFAYKEKLISRNLGQQLRVSKSRGRARGVRGGGEVQAYTLTPEGAAQLRERLEVLREERQGTVQEIRRAAADKDVRENAPLEAARERQGHIDGRIREIEHLLRSASIVGALGDSSLQTQVAPGRRVLLRNVASGAEVSYTVVDPPEANPMSGKLSTTSPVGKALLDQVVGAEVIVPTPRGMATFLILGVE